jgi:YD repeat-containing protein
MPRRRKFLPAFKLASSGARDLSPMSDRYGIENQDGVSESASRMAPWLRLRTTHFLLMTGGFLLSLSFLAGSNAAKAANGSVTYTYDALGRIASASYDTGVFIFYTYDANGNRLSQVVNVNSGALTWTATATPCTSNCWGGALW